MGDGLVLLLLVEAVELEDMFFLGSPDDRGLVLVGDGLGLFRVGDGEIGLAVLEGDGCPSRCFDFSLARISLFLVDTAPSEL